MNQAGVFSEKLSKVQIRAGRGPAIRIAATSFLLFVYLAFVVFAAWDPGGWAPNDYAVFMRIGRALLAGEPVYTENSYYPLPYVAIFSIFALLPRPLSVAFWLLAPVVLALVVTRYRPYALAFAPTIAHTFWGQSSGFGLLGLWGYRLNLDIQRASGGVFLALTCLKPQLALVPVGYALYTWIAHWRKTRRIPKQCLAFVATICLMYLPSLLLWPTWPIEWLRAPRPFVCPEPRPGFSMALSGAVPRLLVSAGLTGAPFWLAWLVLSGLVAGVAWRAKGRAHPLDILVLVGFIVSPLVHDYDLIQVLPVIWGPAMPVVAVLLSLPSLWLMAQCNFDAAWSAAALIAPGLLVAYLFQCQRGHSERCRDASA